MVVQAVLEWCQANPGAAVAAGVGVLIVLHQLLHAARRACARSPFSGSPHVLITGGSQGLGKSLAIKLCAEGCRVTILARRESVLREAVAEIKSFVTASRKGADRGGPIPISFVTADVTDVEAMKAACAQAEEKFGRIQTLICAAGSARTGYFRDIPEGDFAWAMTLNYCGVVNAIKAVEPGMREARSGRIVIVSSALALTGYVGYSAYCPTKWALRGLAEALRNELLPVGVRVHIAYPGNMDTPGFEVENRTKPAEAKAIEADETLYTPGQVADSMLAGIRAGDFHLSSGDFGVDLLTRAMGGMSPRANPVLDALLLPLTVAVGVVYRGMWDREVCKTKHRATAASGAGEARSAGAAK